MTPCPLALTLAGYLVALALTTWDRWLMVLIGEELVVDVEAAT